MSLVCSGTSSKFQHCLLSGTPSIHSSHRRSAPPTHGLAHSHPIESAIVRHEEGNEGKKIGVKRRFAAFYGAKLLKRMGSNLQRNPQRNQCMSTPEILIRPARETAAPAWFVPFQLLLGAAGFEERI